MNPELAAYIRSQLRMIEAVRDASTCPDWLREFLDDQERVLNGCLAEVDPIVGNGTQRVSEYVESAAVHDAHRRDLVGNTVETPVDLAEVHKPGGPFYGDN